MIEDPRVNFAVSTVAGQRGVSHLGLQTETSEELAAIGERLDNADAVALAEVGTTGCYAKSDKLWATDPQGARWETFRSFGEAPTYYSSAKSPAEDGGESACGQDGCCGPAAA